MVNKKERGREERRRKDGKIWRERVKERERVKN
jgi:hypothetical protein